MMYRWRGSPTLTLSRSAFGGCMSGCRCARRSFWRTASSGAPRAICSASDHAVTPGISALVGRMWRQHHRAHEPHHHDQAASTATRPRARRAVPPPSRQSLPMNTGSPFDQLATASLARNMSPYQPFVATNASRGHQPAGGAPGPVFAVPRTRAGRTVLEGGGGEGGSAVGHYPPRERGGGWRG